MKKFFSITLMMFALTCCVRPDVQAQDIGIAPLNLQGDSAYLFSGGGRFAAGLGIDMICAYDCTAALRGEVLFPQKKEGEQSNAIGGLAIMVNVPKLATKLGAQWVASIINPSIGPFMGYDFSARKMEYGLLLTIIKVGM